MPEFITLDFYSYQIMNPTTAEENFAERWNEVPLKKKMFDYWHEEATKFFNQFEDNMGHFKVFESLEKGFGKNLIENINKKYTSNLNSIRNNGILGLGLTQLNEFDMKKNTFFGK